MNIKEVVLTKEEYDKGMEKINDYDKLTSQVSLFFERLDAAGIQVSGNCNILNFTDIHALKNMGDMNGNFLTIELIKR